MGKRGPPKTPTEILKIRGSWRADERKDEPKPQKGAPDCPENLSDEAKQVWEQVVPMLEGMGVLSQVDGNALTRYCAMFARWWKANDFLSKHGDTYPIYQTDKTGKLVRDENGRKVLRYMQQWPQVAIVNKLSTSLLRIEQEFGLTPASRAGLSITPTEEKTNKSRFFGKQA